MRVSSIVWLAAGLGLLLGCASKSVTKTPPMQLVQATSLDQSVAEDRAKLVTDVKYDLEISISKGGENFSGIQKIKFTLLKLPSADVPVDFQGGDIRLLHVNGEKIEAKRGPVFVMLPKTALKKGINDVEIHYSHDYSHSGVGLHKFEDPEDENVYLYTNFEPFDANRFAPFFDQPDIKGSFKLTVNAPKDWEVIANSNETSKNEEGSTRRWEFKETPPISTYLYALVAGPYAKFEGRYKKMKARFFVRKPLAKYVNAKEWLKITAQGLKFYEGYYAISYPFEKYDQIIVPEFNEGAMENVGAVTFSESYLKRGGATHDERMQLGNVILHEMAHQWFGDLVTMKWWNDLWLNESFAEFMSATAEAGATEYTDSWSDFFTDKSLAYKQDQSVITHPISGVVNNTNDAFVSFDDITYGKGAAVLKELNHYVGDDKFREALQLYFKEHSYKNTTLNDFIAAFSETMNKDMTAWFTEWLTTTGVDGVAVAAQCSEKSVRIDVKFDDKMKGAKPRMHTLRIGRFIWRDGKVVHDGDSEYQGQTDGSLEILASGAPLVCPEFLYPNIDDQAYVKVHLDDKSVEFLKAHVAQMPGSLLRQMIWSDLWQKVRDRNLKLADFAKMAADSFESETDPTVLSLVARHLMGGRHAGGLESLYYYWPRENRSEKEAFTELTARISKTFWERLSKEKKDSDVEKLLTDLYLRSVNSEGQTLQLKKLLASLKDEDRRWEVVATLCRIGQPECDMLIEKELKADSSDRGEKEALVCRALRPNMASKKELLDRLSGESTDFSADENQNVTENLFPSLQRDAMASFSESIYKSLQTVWLNKRDDTFQGALATGLAPVYCDSSANQKLESMLHGEGAKWPATLRRPLLERWDDDLRCIEIRKYNR